MVAKTRTIRLSVETIRKLVKRKEDSEWSMNTVVKNLMLRDEKSTVLDADVLTELDRRVKNGSLRDVSVVIRRLLNGL